MKQQKEEVSFLKKIKIPLIIFTVGILITFSLLVALKYTNNKASSLLSESAQNPELFQAPAEVSSEIQAECQKSAEKIENKKTCAEQEDEYLHFQDNCAGVSYATESSEGKYGDLVFKILSCHLKENNKTAASKLIEKVQAMSSWDVDAGGSISCDSKIALKAWLESVQRENKFSCFKKDKLADIARDLNQKKFTVLEALVPQYGVLQFGLVDTDTTCPDTFDQVKKGLESLYKNNVQAQYSESANSETNMASNVQNQQSLERLYINFSQGSESAGMLEFSLNTENCLVFESLLLANPM